MPLDNLEAPSMPVEAYFVPYYVPGSSYALYLYLLVKHGIGTNRYYVAHRVPGPVLMFHHKGEADLICPVLKGSFTNNVID